MRKVWLPLLLALLAVAVLVLRHEKSSLADQQVPPPTMRVVLGLPTQPSNAGWFVGIANGDFARQGVELVNQPHAIGLQALDAVINGQADLAMVADTPLVFAVMRGADLSIVATTYSSRNYMALIARSDRGIAKPSDLKGKKIGYVPKTSGHFFLYSFLLANGLSDGRATPVVVPPGDSVAAIGSGMIDALVTWEPTLSAAQAALGSSAVVFHGPEFYTTRFSLVGRSDYLKAHAAELKALLRGLQQAHQFIHDQPEAARQIVARYLSDNHSTPIAPLVPGDYKAALEQAQLITLEDQARWALKEGLVAAQSVPNFLRHIDLATLAEVAPDAVTLVR